jgi:hypothetical protein
MSNVNTIIINAFILMAASAVEYNKAAEKVRYIRARGEATDAEVRDLAQQALLVKVPAYRAQVSESGKPAKGSAYQRAVSRMMSDTNPNKGEHANHEAKAVRVPRELQDAVAKLLTTYDAKVIREALKRAA